MAPLKLSELADLLRGQVVPPTTTAEFPAATHNSAAGGEVDPLIHNALPLQDATAGCITLLDHDKHLRQAVASPAAAVLVHRPWPALNKPQLQVENLHAAFQQAITSLRPSPTTASWSGVHPTAVVADTATLGDDTRVGPGVTIGEDCRIGQRCVLHAGVHIMAGCHLGDDCELFPNVTLYHQTRLGCRVLIHAGAVLGAYGFGYRQQQGQHVRTAQLGWVDVADDVEIGASTAIDRGTYGPTRIGAGTKIDNLVQIGHNCHIGAHNLICAHVGIAGSTSTGDYVVLAGQVGVADHVHIADRVTVAAQSGVMSNLEAGSTMFGSPATHYRQRMQELACIRRLPEMRSELKHLQTQLAQLTAQLATATEEQWPRREAA